MFASRFDMLAGPFLWLAHFQLIFVEGAISTIAGFAVSAALFFGFSRALHSRFNFFEYLLFYFVYSPLWVAANLAVWAFVLLGMGPKVDWKT